MLLGTSAALSKQALAVLDLLVLLNEGAASTAPSLGQVSKAASFEVVLFANHLALNSDGDAEASNAAGTAHQQALMSVSEDREGFGRLLTYGSVDWLVALEFSIMVHTVEGLAECDAWHAAGDQARVNGVEAVEESSEPGLGIG